MSNALYIRLPATADGALSGYRSGPASAAVRERFADAAAAAGGRVIALAPGADVLLTTATLPTRNRKRMLTAVPFALEEQLISDVDTLHFALGNSDQLGPVPVAVVERRHMQQWLDTLQQVELRPDALLPEQLALPWQQGSWTLLFEEHQVLVRSGAQQGFATEPALAATLLRGALRDAGDAKPQRLQVHLCVPADEELAAVAAEFDLEFDVTACDDPLALFAAHYDAAHAINLLQGGFSRNEQLGRLWKPWRMSAALLAGWMIFGVGARIIDYKRLAHEQTALQEKIEQVYRQAFPDDKNIVNPRVQMERHLAELSGGGNSGAGFLDLLAQAGPALKATPGLTIKSLRSQSGELELELNIKDLQGLDQLKQRLTAAGPLAVEIVSAASRDGKVEGRLKIKGKS